MKIRVMGTKDECLAATSYYRALEKDSNVKYVKVSDLYPNRGSNTLFRVYVEVEYHEVILETVDAREPMPPRRQMKGERALERRNKVEK